MRKSLVLVFFLLQIGGISYSRFVDLRYFCWAPFDQISYYEITAKANGVVLSPQEISKRYAIQSKGRENRSIHHVFSIINHYEESYGKGEKVVVKVVYSTNGKAEEEWNFVTK